jgi:hypothetical protein
MSHQKAGGYHPHAAACLLESSLGTQFPNGDIWLLATLSKQGQSDCSSLDFEWLPRAHVLKAWSPACAALGGGEPLGGGA